MGHVWVHPAGADASALDRRAAASSNKVAVPRETGDVVAQGSGSADGCSNAGTGAAPQDATTRSARSVQQPAAMLITMPKKL